MRSRTLPATLRAVLAMRPTEAAPFASLATFAAFFFFFCFFRKRKKKADKQQTNLGCCCSGFGSFCSNDSGLCQEREKKRALCRSQQRQQSDKCQKHTNHLLSLLNCPLPSQTKDPFLSIYFESFSRALFCSSEEPSLRQGAGGWPRPSSHCLDVGAELVSEDLRNAAFAIVIHSVALTEGKERCEKRKGNKGEKLRYQWPIPALVRFRMACVDSMGNER